MKYHRIITLKNGQEAGTAGIESIGNKYKVRHRAEFGISLIKKYWGLDVVADNERAISMYQKAGFIEYGNPDSPIVLVQPVDDHDLEEMEAEVSEIQRLTSMDFCLIAVKVRSWNQDLSPWKAPAVFGNQDFGNGAADFLKTITELCSDPHKTYYLGGYSLAGLFSLWAAYQTNLFAGIAAASPSVWFPGFLDYAKTHKFQSSCVYLSLGDREERTKNSVMAAVGDCIRAYDNWLKEQKIQCTLEWNKGNHFQDPGLRTARAFSWVLTQPSRTL